MNSNQVLYTFYEEGSGAIYKEKRYITNPTPEKIAITNKELQLKWKRLRLQEKGLYGKREQELS